MIKIKRRSEVLSSINAHVEKSPHDLTKVLTAATLVHLIVQGRRSVEGNTCKYRLEEVDGRGLYCAVGFWIPDAKYDPLFEGKSVTNIEEAFSQRLYPFAVAALRTLQAFHDSMSDREAEDPSWAIPLAVGFYAHSRFGNCNTAIADLKSICNQHFLDVDSDRQHVSLEDVFGLGYTPE